MWMKEREITLQSPVAYTQDARQLLFVHVAAVRLERAVRYGPSGISGATFQETERDWVRAKFYYLYFILNCEFLLN